MSRLERNPPGFQMDRGQPPPNATEHAAVLRAMFRAGIPPDQLDLIEAITVAVNALTPIDPVPLLTRLEALLRDTAARFDLPTDETRLAYSRAEAVRAALAVLTPPPPPSKETTR